MDGWMDGWASERKVTGRGFSSGGACLYAVQLQETTRIAKGRATRGLNGNSDEALTEDDEADVTHQKCCRKRACVVCVRAHHRPDVDDNKDLDGLSRRRPSRALILFPVQFDWGTREQQASSLSPSPSIIHLLSPCAAAAWLAQIGNGACGRLDAQDAPRRPTAYGTQITPTPRFFFLVVPWVWIWSGSNWITSVADAFESASASVSVAVVPEPHVSQPPAQWACLGLLDEAVRLSVYPVARTGWTMFLLSPGGGVQPCNGGRRRQKAPASWTTRTAMVVVVAMMMMEVSEAQAQAGAECVLRAPLKRLKVIFVHTHARTWGKRHGHKLANYD
ncbi:hypothetical protein BGZ61DRAFT_481660 [Ilyonectria robusta]|uniref:uncharacterized protein n=1 Tax=Ilyonectria robusta TaxID=1079257 RepID=UPI001E8DC044|nr:uncharacterized protein BGZ61DRAFT_481660 [Ilyonectria robusta]KAH8677043.1 hypothetical protein BGZ61DRAFT_481660 [Ilyonectria robusta]